MQTIDAFVRHAGSAQARPADVPQLRKELPAAFPGRPLPNSLLKHLDEQALLGLSALRAATTPPSPLPSPPSTGERGNHVLPCPLKGESRSEGFNLTTGSFHDWGLVACPRRPGRNIMRPALARFMAEGAWSVSPHIVPNCSLHSLSGLLSMALDLHGPNLGAGGVPGSEGEAVLAALTLLAGDRLPGVWIVFTGWQAEASASEAICHAVAVGLTSDQPGGARLRWSPSASQHATFEMESLLNLLRPAGQRADTSWSLGSNGRLDYITEERR